MTKDIFISYSSQDQAIAFSACQYLENNNFSCWIAPRDILPGIYYGESILSAIAESKVFILIFSSSSNNSPQVIREIERAVSKGIKIIPFRIEEILPSKAMEYFISSSHWLDAFNEKAEKSFEKLKNVLYILLGETASTSKEITKRKRKPPIKWIIACAVLAIVTFCFLFIFKWRSLAPPIRSIAVLPFLDLSPQKDQEYFCDGMTEELINRLGNVRELKVPARTSVFTFKGKAENISDIGQKLNVETVLEGSIRKAGNKLRITAQLINIADGYHLWSETYDRDLKEVFAIQDEISSSIVEALKLKLTSTEKQKISTRPMDNIEAYEYYLRAMKEINRFTEDALDHALQNLQKGIEISGDNALLYSGMALVYMQYVNIGVKQEEYIMKAEGCIKKTLQLDPHSPQAYEHLGAIELSFRGNPQEAVCDFKKALFENPNDVHSMHALSNVYIMEGKSFAALPLLEKCKRIDPLNLWYNFFQGVYNYYGSNYGLALEQFRNEYLLDTEDVVAQYMYSLMLAHNNDLKKAFSVMEQSIKKNPDNVVSKLGLMLKYGLMKNKDKVLQEMTPEFQKTCRRDPDWSYHVSVMLSLADIKKEALDWLDNAVNRGFLNYPFLQKDPFLDNIRNEDRFKKLMEHVKYEWEHFQV